MSEAHTPGGVIAALSSSETGTQGPSIEPTGTGPFRLSLAVLVLAVLYPYPDTPGSCEEAGCPEHWHAPASTELPAGTLVAVLAAVPAVAFAGSVRRRFTSDRKPAEIYLELFVIRAICKWCVASAVLVVAYLVLGALRLRDAGSDAPETAGGR